jgi:hypothetical protein
MIELQRSSSICDGMSIEVRVIGVGGARWRAHAAAKPATAATSAAASGIHGARRFVGAMTGTGTPTCEAPPSAIHLSSLPRSAAFCQRSSGSFAKHFFTTRSSAGGDIGVTCEIGGGSSFMIEEISDACVPPANALRPVAISYSRHPNAKMSVRASASFPSSCSGAMYWNVPRIVPSCVRLWFAAPITVGSDVTPEVCTGDAIAFASPKSSSFTPPAGPTASRPRETP